MGETKWNNQKKYQKTKTLQPKPTKKTPTCVVVQIKCIEH